jgi:hypothetical protein
LRFSAQNAYLRGLVATGVGLHFVSRKSKIGTLKPAIFLLARAFWRSPEKCSTAIIVQTPQNSKKKSQFSAKPT